MSETIDAVGSAGKAGLGRLEYDGMHWSGRALLFGCIPYRLTAEPRNVEGARGFDLRFYFDPPPAANDRPVP